VIPFSRKTGSPTFGTAGKLAYNWEVNRVPYVNWQGEGTSRLEHPPRQVRSAPDLFEYTRHLEGTYPPWFDPAYWNAGTRVPLRLGNQFAQLFQSARFYVNLFVDSAAAVATLLALLVAGRHLRGHLALLLPALAALAVYAPVHLEPRYVAPFAALLWLVPVAAARPAPGHAQLFTRATALAALLLAGPVAFYTVLDLGKGRDETKPHRAVAAELRRLGLVPGDRVANVGVERGENFGSSFEGYWAYLAGVHIAAEVPEHRGFICGDPRLVAQAFGEMAAVGVRAAVTRAIQPAACSAGWRPVPGTDFYVRMLAPASERSPDTE
jgi:hypothetical protein